MAGCDVYGVGSSMDFVVSGTGGLRHERLPLGCTVLFRCGGRRLKTCRRAASGYMRASAEKDETMVVFGRVMTERLFTLVSKRCEVEVAGIRIRSL